MDWNNDGKKDLVSGQSTSGARLNIFLNTGTDESPAFSGKTHLQVGGAAFEPVGQSTPFIIDWNHDGKKDVLCGAGVDGVPGMPWPENNGLVYYLENTGTDVAPVFSSSTFIQDGGADLDAGKRSAPVALDWDRDGAKDLIVGDYIGKLKFYRNIGTDAAPAFNGYTFIQAGGSDIDVGYYSRPALGDLDHDGVQDLVVGSFDGGVTWYHVNPVLILSLPASATEGDATLAGQGTVSLDCPAAGDLVVALTSEDTSEITVPPTVTILSSNTSATFDITVANDGDLDGSQLVAITASAPSAPEFGVHRQCILIHDNE